MNIGYIIDKAVNRERLTREEALALYRAPLPELAAAADRLRRESVDDPSVVTWQIDRNVNITNGAGAGWPDHRRQDPDRRAQSLSAAQQKG